MNLGNEDMDIKMEEKFEKWYEKNKLQEHFINEYDEQGMGISYKEWMLKIFF